MAFKDIEVMLYGDKVKINYLDKPHMYFARDRIDWNLPTSDPKAWGKARRPKGTTTLLEDTLEKKGLLTWPMGLALGELFGFYNFTNENAEKMVGFSKDKGTLWTPDIPFHNLNDDLQEDELLTKIKSASEAWLRKKKKGADIGNVVHDAIEHFVTGEPFNILEQYTANIEEAEYENEAALETARGNIVEDVGCAELAFDQFKKWWVGSGIKLISAEQLVYSLKYDFSGTFDALLDVDGRKVVADWKTSNASTSKEAAAPQGIYYTYFIQSAMYALALVEMGVVDAIDDLLIVSARKDGTFDTLFASEVGLSMEDCYDWARAAIKAYRLREATRKQLIEQGILAGRIPDPKAKKEAK